jgi:serine/threonine protein kinase
MAKNPSAFETLSDVYTVTGIVGEGGSGRVFAVSDSTGAKYALKCLFPHLITTQKRKRFKNEIDFCSKQKHQNLIQVIDSGLEEWDRVKVPFYVMPLVAETLRKLCEKKIPVAQVLPLFSQILDGVEAAHLLGVTHRDLKPENILYDTEHDRLMIADFGIARFEEEIIATAVETKAADKLLNIRYSAPEQQERGAHVGQRADIFALGLILNEMFTGTVPQGTGYKTIVGVAPNFAYLDGIVDRMIQNDPNARPAGIEEVKKELIGRGNAFVALQQLDAKQREIVSAVAPGKVAPVNLMGADWNKGTLTLQLDRVPEPGWLERFRNPQGSWSEVLGKGPKAFYFGGRAVSIQSSDYEVQQLVDNFKQYLQMATAGYQTDLETQSARRERELRKHLEEEVAEAEKRERILKNLKI